MGIQISTDDSATVGWILMIHSADPNEMLKKLHAQLLHGQNIQILKKDNSKKSFFFSELQQLEVGIPISPIKF